MSRVFAVQNQHRWSKSQERFVPKFDLNPASTFGEVFFLLGPTAAPFRPEPIIRELKEKLREYTKDDHLLLVGNPILIGFAVAIAVQYTRGQASLLQWSGKDQRYIQVTTNSLFTSPD